MAPKNPFSPTFGASPPMLAGRDDILENVDDALATGPTHPDYTTLLIGVRGAGKTVMLNAIEDLARSRGWLTLSDDASPSGLLLRLARSAAELLSGQGDAAPSRHLKSLTLGGFGLELEPASKIETSDSLRTVLSSLGDRLAENGTGLLITLDELQSGDLDEIRELGAVVQHVTRREQRPVAFAGAALPQIEDTLLSDGAATFLQRCSRYDIDRLDPRDASAAIAEPIKQSGATIDPRALEEAVTATAGYAFMVQLVGFHTWKAAADPSGGITAQEVAVGISEAEQRIGRLVLNPTWRGLSDVDRRFLIAMARDNGVSKLGEIASRLEVDVKYAGVYRQRLIKAGMVVAAGKGRVGFAHPATRDWIRSEAAYTAAPFTDD